MGALTRPLSRPALPFFRLSCLSLPLSHPAILLANLICLFPISFLKRSVKGVASRQPGLEGYRPWAASSFIKSTLWAREGGSLRQVCEETRGVCVPPVARAVQTISVRRRLDLTLYRWQAVIFSVYPIVSAHVQSAILSCSIYAFATGDQ